MVGGLGIDDNGAGLLLGEKVREQELHRAGADAPIPIFRFADKLICAKYID